MVRSPSTQVKQLLEFGMRDAEPPILRLPAIRRTSAAGQG